MKLSKNQEKFPLAINILKYQVYNFNFFNCQEIVLYETLVILGGKSFKNKEFFHSTQTIADKTGIKRHSVDKILKKFKEHGIIEYQIKGMPKVKYITLLWDNIMELLPEIYQFDEFKKLFSGTTKPLFDYYKLLAESNKEKNINKNTYENIKIEKTANAAAEEHISILEGEFNEIFHKSVFKYNKQFPSNKKEPRSIEFHENDSLKINTVLNKYPKNELLNSFSTYCDEFLLGNVSVNKSLLGYFLKEEGLEFPVIERYLIHYLRSHTKININKTHKRVAY
tara:strand:- start:21 stop:863 length:843 start_codon:yes stop_codon:yes gene_type:complete